MPYQAPTFNLLANIWDCRVPFDGAPDWEDVPVQKYIRSRMSLDTESCDINGWWRTYTPPIQLRFPRDNAAFFGIPASWTHTIFEVPAGSGQYYRVFWQEVQHQGFPNEYAIILVQPCTDRGYYLPPPGAFLPVDVGPDVCEVSPPPPPPPPMAYGMANMNSSATECIGWLVQDSGAATVLEDFFVDAPGTDLTSHVMDIGGGWDYMASGSDWAIGAGSASAVRVVDGTPFTITVAGTSDRDGEVFSLWTVNDHTNDQFGVVTRVYDESNYYVAYFDMAAGNYELGKVEAGVYTSLASDTFVAAFSNGQTARVRLAVVGSALSANFVGPALGNTKFLGATDSTFP